MQLVAGPFSPVIAEWVADRIGRDIDWGPCEAIGVADKDDNLVGGVVFNNYQPQFGSIEVSFAAVRSDWLTPRLLSSILAYPFEQLECSRITSLTPKRNRRARQFLQKFGFKHEGTVRRGFGDDDCIVSGLLASEWAVHRFNRGSIDGKAQAPGCPRPGRAGECSSERQH